MLISLRSVQDGTRHIIGHAGHLGSTLCDPQQLVSCLVIQRKVDPVCGIWKKKCQRETTFSNENKRSYILEDRLCMWARGCWARRMECFL